MAAHKVRRPGHAGGVRRVLSQPSGSAGSGSSCLRRTRFARVAVALAVAVAAGVASGWLYGRLHQHEIRNVVFISLDTCRADRLSCYGYRRKTTPHIDAVAREGVLFRDALTPVPFTLPAHSSVMTGTYPPTHGVHLNNGGHLADSNLTLAEILREAGYQTAAFVGAFVLDSRFGLNQGFDTYDFQETKKSRKDDYDERTAEEVNRPALAWLGKHATQPFFLFLHYFDPHQPYEPPSPYASLYADDLYAGEIAYMDSCIGAVVDRLRALGAYDKTLLIIAGDHGQGLGEHGEATHGYFIYNSTLRVPLIIRAPGGTKGSQVEGNVSLVDIVPTVLDLIGLKTPAQVEGVSLRRCLERGKIRDGLRAVYAEAILPATFGCGPLHGIVAGPWKYVRAPKQELYDLDRDPGEQRNVAGKEPQVAQKLRGQLDAMLQRMGGAAHQEQRASVDIEAVRRLQSLGYAGGGFTPATAAFDPSIEDPKDFLPLYNRWLEAHELYIAGHNERAKKAFQDLVSQRPNLITAYRYLAKMAFEDHRAGDARQYVAIITSLLSSTNDVSRRVPVSEANYTMVCCYNDLAKALVSEGKFDEAVVEYEKILRIEPGAAEIHNDLGNVLQQQGRYAEAIGHYERAAQLNQRRPEVKYNLARALVEIGELPEAMGYYEQALQIRPDYADAHFHLGVALQQAGRLSEAIGHYEQALRIEPDSAQTHYNLAMALEQTGKLSESVGHYTEAVRLNADMPVALNNLAWIRATSMDPQIRDGIESVRLAERACQLTHRNLFPPLDTLAAAYAEMGRFPEAASTAQEALALAKAANQNGIVEEIESRLSLYRASQPYRQKPRAMPSPAKPDPRSGAAKP